MPLLLFQHPTLAPAVASGQLHSGRFPELPGLILEGMNLEDPRIVFKDTTSWLDGIFLAVQVFKDTTWMVFPGVLPFLIPSRVRAASSSKQVLNAGARRAGFRHRRVDLFLLYGEPV